LGRTVCDSHSKSGNLAVIFHETTLKGVFLIEVERNEDDRGFFARTFCQKEFESHGINWKVSQCNISYNRKKGTLRGMHFQIKPHEEAKLVRVTKGIVYDVILDLRPDSPTFKNWITIELSSDNRKSVYIPEGLAHGFQTLQDDTEVFYQMSELYHAESARGLRWNDPAFSIKWPIEEKIISTKDSQYPDFE